MARAQARAMRTDSGARTPRPATTSASPRRARRPRGRRCTRARSVRRDRCRRTSRVPRRRRQALLRRLVALTDRLYADTPGFIPPLRQQLDDFYAGKAPYFRHGQIRFLSAVRDGVVVARTTA